MSSRDSATVFTALEEFALKFRRGDLLTLALTLASFCKQQRLPRLKRNSATHRRSIVLPGFARPLRSTCFGTGPDGVASAELIADLAGRDGVQAGSINPNLFQDQIYKQGSFGNPDPKSGSSPFSTRSIAIEIAHKLHGREVSMWFAERSNYPGTANIRQRNSDLAGKRERMRRISS